MHSNHDRAADFYRGTVVSVVRTAILAVALLVVVTELF
jgi:hypothetical protein